MSAITFLILCCLWRVLFENFLVLFFYITSSFILHKDFDSANEGKTHFFNITIIKSLLSSLFQRKMSIMNIKYLYYNRSRPFAQASTDSECRWVHVWTRVVTITTIEAGLEEPVRWENYWKLFYLKCMFEIVDEFSWKLMLMLTGFCFQLDKCIL